MITNSTANYTLAVQSAAVIITAVGVICTIMWNIRVTRRRTTLEMLLSEQTNKLLLEYRSQYLAAAKEGKLEAMAGQDTYYYSPESFFLVSTLNRCDLVAIGIREGIIDERTYKAYWRSSYVRDWSRCKASVITRRQCRGDPGLFIDFEQLACKWANADERPLL